MSNKRRTQNPRLTNRLVARKHEFIATAQRLLKQSERLRSRRSTNVRAPRATPKRATKPQQGRTRRPVRQSNVGSHQNGNGVASPPPRLSVTRKVTAHAGLTGEGGPRTDVVRNFLHDAPPIPKPHDEKYFTRGAERGMVLCGTDFVTSLKTDHASGPGEVMMAISLNPLTWGGTRIQQFAQLYQRFRPKKLEFVYTPVVPSTQGGALIMYITVDINLNGTLERGDAMLRDAMSIEHAISFNAFNYATSEMRFDLKDEDWFYSNTDGAGRFSSPGLWRAVLAGTVGTTNIVTLGLVSVNYEIEFMGQALMPVATPSVIIEKNVTASTFTMAQSEHVKLTDTEMTGGLPPRGIYVVVIQNNTATAATGAFAAAMPCRTNITVPTFDLEPGMQLFALVGEVAGSTDFRCYFYSGFPDGDNNAVLAQSAYGPTNSTCRMLFILASHDDN